MKKKGIISILVAVGIALIAIIGAWVAYSNYQYNKSPRSRFFTITCGWKDMVVGDCDEYQKRDYQHLTMDEVDWISQYEHVSKEDILAYAKQYLEYRKEQVAKYGQRGVEDQIKRLENVIDLLEEK